MKYDDIHYVPEDQDPSITIETANLVAKVIDNTGLLLPPNPEVRSYFGKYGTGSFLPFSHHLGYHGIRALYDKTEKRNLVVPLTSWLNLQGVNLAGIENDPVDERAAYGVGRGWPMRLARKGGGAILTVDPMRNTQFSYSLEIQPVEPDGLEFHIRFVFHRRPDTGSVRFQASWPCYINAYDDVRFFYPAGSPGQRWAWASLGEKPDIVLAEAVGYRHQQEVSRVADQSFPVGFGRIGSRALVLMFTDPRVNFFVVNAGGHSSISAVQNPAWDFEWAIDDYPLDTPVGFTGRLIYTVFQNEEQITRRCEEWKAQ
jgi:hypothetical protein